MELNAALGKYSPTFFAIRLEFSESIKNVEDIPKHLLPTFYHEYFHFLQDITTPYGIHFAWNNINAVVQSVASLQSYATTEITIPISEPYKTNIIEQVKVLKALNGDNKVANLIESEDGKGLTIKSIKLNLRAELTNFDSAQQSRFVLLDLQDGDDEYQYWFGAKAIIEGMAELIEEKHFGLTGSAQFPYKILQDYIVHVIPELRDRKDIMFALGDVSLLTNNPGYYLNDFLVNSNLRNQIPDDPKEIYSLCEDFFQNRGYSWLRIYSEYKENMLKNVNEIFGHEAYSNEKVWINAIIEKAYTLRKEVPGFLLDIYLDEDALSDNFMSILESVGTPDIVNYQLDRFFVLPGSLRGQEENTHPILMTALQQFFYDLLYARPKCSLLEICRNHEPKWITSKCYENQWEKIQEDIVCPLVSFYHVFGFKKVIHTKAD